jgi:sugar phosphate isomerase/epimerase
MGGMRMKIAFTTLGCPTWDLDTICRKAREYGFDGVDFRGLQGQIDVTLSPEFTRDLALTKRKLADARIVVSGISSSIKLCEASRLRENIEEARRTIPMARELGVAAIRVFGGGDVEVHSKEELAAIGERTMAAVLELHGARTLRWAFETHDHWISSADCKVLLDRIPDPAFGALWDLGHTARVGGEAPKETMRALGDRIFYLHVKDAVYDPDHPQAMEDGWRYVAPGTGQLPLAEGIGLLRKQGYDGWLIFEHEKRWHPELPEPEETLPQFVTWIRAILE